MDYRVEYEAALSLVERELADSFRTDCPQGELLDAMRYSLLAGGKREKESSGILDLLGGQDAETAELDAKTQQLKTQMKCLEISMRMMKGKKVPPEDEQYLMENDPEGYRITMAMRKPPKKDEEECESVLDDEDRKKTGEASGEPAPAEGPSGGEEGGAASHGGE